MSHFFRRLPVVAACSIVAIVALAALLLWSPGTHSNGSTTNKENGTGNGAGNSDLVVYCAAGIRPAIAPAIADYEKEFKTHVEVNYGPSQALLNNAEITHRGDLYIPGDDTYIEMARKKNLCAETIPLAVMHPVLAVKKGNPKRITDLNSLLTGDRTLCQANPDAAAIGRLTRQGLQALGKWDAFNNPNHVVTKDTVNAVALDVKLGTAEAGFIWDATARQMSNDLDSIAISGVSDLTSTVALTVLKSTPNATRALHLARYLAASDRGLKHFGDAGYTPASGDQWADRPEVLLYAGSMLRPAIEQTITEFELREGCRMSRVYNGCGILVAQMKAGQRPDAYFACDKQFMRMVPDLFPAPVDVSMNQLVILVPHGNPMGIKTLSDLGRMKLRVGVGHEKQCAMGALTQQTLVQGGQYQQVRKNVVDEAPSGDMLVNKLLVGGLDACVAYLSNAAGHADKLDAIKIDLSCAIAIEPYGVLKDSPNSRLMQRFFDAIRTSESRARFEAFGFRWQ